MAQYYLSGAVAARVDGTPAALGGPKQRCVLAVLLANHGAVVSIDRLIDAVARNNLFFVPPELIQRHTPRLLDGAEQLCRHLETARGRRTK